MREFTTPMMKQYQQLKKQYSDCLLFFRLGDFYELFLEDAKIGAKVLDIVLTKRPRGKDGDIPMAGVPFHAAQSYLSKLVRAGYKVAICEQVSEANGKGLVDRKVVRIVTPGTLMDENNLKQKENNYIASFSLNKKHLGIAFADLSTGNFQTKQSKIKNDLKQILTNELSRFNPSEIILSPSLYNNPEFLTILTQFGEANIFCFQEWNEYIDNDQQYLKKHFKVKTLRSFNLHDKGEAAKACTALLAYLKDTQQSNIKHIQTISEIQEKKYLILDNATISNLELLGTLKDNKKKGSLINHLDHTFTPMGGRKLRQCLLKPLSNIKDIQASLDAVDELLQNAELREQLSFQLREITDIERIISKLAIDIERPIDLLRLKESLKHSLITKQLLKKTDSRILKNIKKEIAPTLKKIIILITDHIVDDPPVDPKQGKLIKQGIDKKLDKLKKIINNSEQFLTKLEKQEKEKTSISTLKIKFNKVFGFYIEVSKGNLDKVPKHYQRKQTLVNAERFITDELKKHEEIILTAQEKTQKIEYHFYQQLVKKILKKVDIIAQCAQQVANLDCLVNFAIIAEKHDYCRPDITDKGKLSITDGRHPVVESLFHEKQFVPNDVLLNKKDHQLLVITGPNMAGKSVFIRQVAIISLMAHMGSFVPAKKAQISLLDKIFVRSGASDVITAGLSTFMVEMVETAYILNNASNKSLIIMDEIGRGTSTYDGISIAWAIAQYLVTNKKKQAKTLFATHYHELQKLEEKFPKKIKNYRMAITSSEDEPIFLHKLERGATSHSFGVAVAKLAGVPKKVTKNAEQMLAFLEQSKTANQKQENRVSVTKKDQPPINQQFGDLIKELAQINLNQTTPLEALNKLSKLKIKYAKN